MLESGLEVAQLIKDRILREEGMVKCACLDMIVSVNCEKRLLIDRDNILNLV